MTLPMEKATYRAVATGSPIHLGWSTNNNGQISVEFEIVDVNSETGEEVLTGETITWIGTFSDNTTNRTLESLMHAGWQGEDPGELEGKSGSAELAVAVDLVCEPEEYKSKWQLKVQWVNKPGRGHFAFKTAMTETDRRSFGAQMRANAQAVRATLGAPRAAKPAAGAPATRTSGYSGGGSQHPNAPGKKDGLPF